MVACGLSIHCWKAWFKWWYKYCAVCKLSLSFLKRKYVGDKLRNLLFGLSRYEWICNGSCWQWLIYDTVGIVIGIAGGCRWKELTNFSVNDIENKGDSRFLTCLILKRTFTQDLQLLIKVAIKYASWNRLGSN